MHAGKTVSVGNLDERIIALSQSTMLPRLIHFNHLLNTLVDNRNRGETFKVEANSAELTLFGQAQQV